MSKVWDAYQAMIHQPKKKPNLMIDQLLESHRRVSGEIDQSVVHELVIPNHCEEGDAENG